MQRPALLILLAAVTWLVSCGTWQPGHQPPAHDDDAADDDGADDDAADDDGADDDAADDDAADDDVADDDVADDDVADDDTGDDDTDICDNHPGEVICDGSDAVECDALGDILTTEFCDPGVGLFCLPSLGCVMCSPGEQWCQGDDVVECDPDGQNFTVIDPCDVLNGEVCITDTCWSLCDLAAQDGSTIGCEFFAVDTDQHDLGPETVQYAVALSNVDPALTAQAVIEAWNGNSWTQEWGGSINPQDLVTVNLPDRHVDDTAINPGGAYRITSTIPIIAYQFNPVDGQNSYLSDASLLIPTPALDTIYRVPGWDQAVDNTGIIQHSSIDVVATVPNTQVTITPSIATLGGGNVPAGTAGVPFQVTLADVGDYVQIASDANQQSLAGTLVETTNQPVAVFAGHECALIPNPSTCCCDHMEEQVIGQQTWGQGYVAARIPHRGPPVEACLWQIVAGSDPVNLTFTAHADVTGLPGPTQLQPGQVLEFQASGSTANPGDFEVSGDAAFLLTQYMLSSQQSAQYDQGDPAMVQAVPVDQYMDNYVILVPGTWNNDYLIITRPVGATVHVGPLDIDTWPDWSEVVPIGGGAYEAVRLRIADGVQVLTGSDPFGVVVVGFDQHDSYAYPGGLDQEIINPE